MTFHHLLQLFNAKTGTKTTLFDTTCKEGSYAVASTATRLFASDCNGLYSR